MDNKKFYKPMRRYCLYDFVIVSRLDPRKIVGAGFCSSRYLPKLSNDMSSIGNYVMIINSTKSFVEHFYINMYSK